MPTRLSLTSHTKAFAREKFGLKHRYVMALHTHQRHPHVHLVVKAGGTDGRRLHIDKAVQCEWRQDFARQMRKQGIAANATPRSVRGQTKRAPKDASNPAHARLAETRKAVIEGWNAVASKADLMFWTIVYIV